MELTEEDPRTGQKRKYKAPIFVRYERILNLQNLLKPEKWRAYKEELFGTDTEVFTPEHFNELEIVKSLGIDFRAWERSYSIDLKARLIAKVQLSTLVEIVRRHDSLQREKLKKKEEESRQKQQAALKKSPKRKR